MNYQLNIFLIYLTSTVLCTTLWGTKATVAEVAETPPTVETTKESKSIIEDLDKIEIEQLRIPTSPVLNLLDESGRVINRPTTPKSFGLSLVESFSNSNGDFPQGLALELAPYWWFQQPDISFDDYYNANVGQTILQTLSFSLASTNQTLEETDSTGAGFGLRFNILAGQANPALETEINKLEKVVEKCSGKIGEPLSPIEDNKECLEENVESINTTAKKIQDLDGSRVGWQLELASATTFNILDDDLDDADLARVGAWLTSSYRPTNSESFLNQFSFLGIARYIYEDISDDSQSIVDLGTGIVWQNETMPISVSLEYLHRFAEDDDDRLVGIAEYRISNQYSAFISYGKDFENFSGNDDLVTLVGLKFGLGKGAVVDPGKLLFGESSSSE